MDGLFCAAAAVIRRCGRRAAVEVEVEGRRQDRGRLRLGRLREEGEGDWGMEEK